jgi:hypothetical protein
VSKAIETKECCSVVEIEPKCATQSDLHTLLTAEQLDGTPASVLYAS